MKSIKKYRMALKNILCIAVFAALLAANIGGIGKAAYVSGNISSEEIAVPILMYHSVCYNKTKSDYIITPEMLEADFKYLKDNGYNTVFVSDLVSFVKDGLTLPENPVVLTFDDGHINNLTYVLPLAEKYDLKFSVSVVGIFSENASKNEDKNPNYAYLSWDDIAELKNSGRAEICSHTYNLHSIGDRKGCMKKSGESADDYKTVLQEDLENLQSVLSDKCGIMPEIFTYPYGLVSDESVGVIREMGFNASLNCVEKTNYLSYGDTDKLFSLCRYNRSFKRSAENILAG
ncbi:MAG: polysaccharide deacetylase family protein [Acutalibacteraceae bacterium]